MPEILGGSLEPPKRPLKGLCQACKMAAPRPERPTYVLGAPDLLAGGPAPPKTPQDKLLTRLQFACKGSHCEPTAPLLGLAERDKQV